MAPGHPHRRLRRDAAAVAAAALLATLCAPAVLLAQDPDVVPDPITPSEDPSSANPGPAPDPAASPPTQAAPPQPAAEPEQPPVADAPEPAPAAPLAVASGATTVTMADFSFSPATVTVDQGDTVTWTNAGPAEPHTATGDGFDTGEVAVGSSGSATFAQAGSFAYVCTLHPQMSGTVEVVAAGGGGGQEGADPNTAAPGSEAAAVAAPDAAGTASKLPSTGLVATPLALIGLGLLAVGVRLRRGADGLTR